VEFDIATATDTVVVVLVPESGDGIQAMKAGLMEIGDLFLVNKADREGADRVVQDLESMLDFRPRRDGWRPEVHKTVAARNEGLEELIEAIARHRRHLESTGALGDRRRRVLRLRLLGEAKQALLERLQDGDEAALNGLLDQVVRREVTPHDAARTMLTRLVDPATEAKPAGSA
jgi:LAO/AO transport system kinase